MYREKFNIAEFNQRPVFENWTFTQDAGGGNVKTLLNSFYRFAKMDIRTGFQGNNQAQQQWEYDIKVIVRFTPDIVSTSTMIFENARYTINSVAVNDYGAKRFLECKCRKVDGDVVTGGTPTPFGPAYVFNYTGVGGEYEFTEPTLINKTIFGAFMDGLQFRVIFTGTPTGKQVLYSPATGRFFWSVPFEPSTEATIQYV